MNTKGLGKEFSVTVVHSFYNESIGLLNPFMQCQSDFENLKIDIQK
jgi:hypothetical protein